MDFSAFIQEILQSDVPAAFKRFGRLLDAQWVESALEETGTASVRRRKLPAELVVWLVIGMGLFRDRAIQEVVSHLGLLLPGQKEKGGKGKKTLVPSAIPQARYRVGAEPLEKIFSRTAEKWAHAEADKDRWRGLALYGMDGTTLRVPDTEENRETFGLPGTGSGQAGYPQVRFMGLMALRSHLLAEVVFGPCLGKKTGEQTLVRDLWPIVPDNSLVIVDRGLINYGLFYGLYHNDDGEMTGRKNWLTRAKKNAQWKTLKTLAPGDELVELKLGHELRRQDPNLPETMVARAIRYEVRGYQPQTLLTSLIDAESYPAAEVAALYHERWELEIGYDELKTHMLERQETLRSKKPEGIRQEIWGIMLVYNLVRKEMLEVALEAGVIPRRVSFRHSLQLIRIFCLVEAWTMSPGNLPKRLGGLVDMMGLLILPERRSERRYERHVKIKESHYKKNPGRPQKKGRKPRGK
jgi:hypothetical protein